MDRRHTRVRPARVARWIVVALAAAIPGTQLLAAPLAAVATTEPAAPVTDAAPPASPDTTLPDTTLPDTTPGSDPVPSDAPTTDVAEPATTDVSATTEPAVDSSAAATSAPPATDVETTGADTTEVLAAEPIVSATMAAFADDDADFVADSSAAVFGEPTAVSVVLAGTNDSADGIEQLSLRLPSASAPAELDKLDAATALVNVEGAPGATAHLSVGYADGAQLDVDVVAGSAVPIAGAGQRVVTVEVAVAGEVAPGAAVTLAVHGALNDSVDEDDLGDGASPGVDVCGTATAVAGTSTASDEACAFVVVEAAPDGGLILLAAVIAAWTLEGANPSWTGTSTLPAIGFPPATFATNSNTPTIPSGASAFLGASTPFGTAFDSTQNQPYLNLRAAAGGIPSTTTFTFDTPTPVGWGFALGDVDADAVTISASGPGGPLTAAELGFEGGFNYCAFSPVPPSCGGPSTDVPSWVPGTMTLTGNVLDTNGAAGWFRPTVSITSLTLTFTVLSGIPIYQVWFAAPTSVISGQVTEQTPGGLQPPPPGTVVELHKPDGSPVTDSFGDPLIAIVAPDGGYVLPDVASDDYEVLIVPPPGYEVVGAATRPADASAGDVAVDFVLQVPPPTTMGSSTTTSGPVATTNPPGVTTTTSPRGVTTTTSPPGATTTTLQPGATTTTGTAGGVGGSTTTTTAVSGRLPATGAPTSPTVLLAWTALLAGAGLLVTVRRRVSSTRP